MPPGQTSGENSQSPAFLRRLSLFVAWSHIAAPAKSLSRCGAAHRADPRVSHDSRDPGTARVAPHSVPVRPRSGIEGVEHRMPGQGTQLRTIVPQCRALPCTLCRLSLELGVLARRDASSSVVHSTVPRRRTSAADDAEKGASPVARRFTYRGQVVIRCIGRRALRNLLHCERLDRLRLCFGTHHAIVVTRPYSYSDILGERAIRRQCGATQSMRPVKTRQRALLVS